MTTTMTTVNSILKEIYEGDINDQLPEEAVVYKRIEPTSDGVVDTVGGKYVTFPVRVTRNAGISYRAENTALGASGQQGYAAAQISLKYGYGRFEVTGQVMDLAEENPQAFSSALQEEMDRLKDDLTRDCNRISWGNSNGNGIVAMITDATTSATHNVDTAQLLDVNMVVDVLVSTTGSATGGGTGLVVTAFDPDSAQNTVTFGTSIGATVAGSHAIYRAGNRGLEPTGILDILKTTGLLYNIDPAVQQVWKANRIWNNGTLTALTESNMIKACDLARTKGGSKISVIFCSLGVRRAYFNLLTQQRRYTEPKNYPGGFVGLPFNYGTEIPVVEDPVGPLNRMAFLNESKIKVYRRRAWYFEDKDGSVFKWMPGYDKWEGLMKQYWEVGTSQRNAHSILQDITEG